MALDSLISSHSHKKPLTLKPLLLSLFILGLTVPLIGCQTTPTSVVTPAQSNTSLTAAQLVQNTMLHRFDTSYNYQKTITYHATPYTPPNDIEANDTSLMDAFFKNSGKKKAKKSVLDDKPTKVASEASKNTDDILNSDNEIGEKDSYPVKNSSKNSRKHASQNAADAAKAAADAERAVNPSRVQPSAKNAAEAAKKAADAAKADADKNAADAAADAKDIVNQYNLMQNDLTQATPSTKTQDKDKAYNSPYIRGVQRTIDKLKQNKSTDTQSKVAHAAKNSDTSDNNDTSPANDEFSQLIRQLKLTPQQIQAMDATYFSPKTVSYTGSYHQPSAQYSSVYEQKLQTRFMEKYQRVPVLVDLNRMSITLEPDAAFAFMALFASNIDADNSEKITQLASKSVKFTLPAKLTQKIPLPVLKDSLLTAIGQAYGDIDPKKFSEIVVDDYGKNLHANRAVKLNLTPKALGNLIGRSLKHWAINLNQISQAHPEYIQNYPEFSKTLELMTLINQRYRAEDLARFAQFMETILPIGYSGYNYYYFNANNQLIGYRKTTDYSSSLLNARLTATTQSQIQYTNSPTPLHPYYQPAPSDIIDGNALLAEMANTDKLKKAARNARWTYPDPDGDLAKEKQRYQSKGYKSKYAKKSPYRQKSYHKKSPTLSDY